MAHLLTMLSTLKNFAFQVGESRILSVLEKASDEVVVMVVFKRKTYSFSNNCLV